MKLFVSVSPMLTVPSKNEFPSLALTKNPPVVGISLFGAALTGPQCAYVVCLWGHFSQTSWLTGTLQSEFLCLAPHLLHCIFLQSRIKWFSPHWKQAIPEIAWTFPVSGVLILDNNISERVEEKRNVSNITGYHCS